MYVCARVIIYKKKSLYIYSCFLHEENKKLKRGTSDKVTLVGKARSKWVSLARPQQLTPPPPPHLPPGPKCRE